MAIENPVEACRFHLQDTDESVFTDPQIQEFLDLEKRNDASGLRPTDTNWTPTYDVLSAAGRGWLWLAGRAENKAGSYRLGDVSITVDPGYCRRMAASLLGSASGVALRSDEIAGAEADARTRHE